MCINLIKSNKELLNKLFIDLFIHHLPFNFDLNNNINRVVFICNQSNVSCNRY